jgi:hypothetical protein
MTSTSSIEISIDHLVPNYQYASLVVSRALQAPGKSLWAASADLTVFCEDPLCAFNFACVRIRLDQVLRTRRWLDIFPGFELSEYA